jgi:hypothetical protein
LEDSISGGPDIDARSSNLIAEDVTAGHLSGQEILKNYSLISQWCFGLLVPI